MLSSAALAAAAHSLDDGEGQLEGGGLDLNLLVQKLQVYTRVENVSSFNFSFSTSSNFDFLLILI